MANDELLLSFAKLLDEKLDEKLDKKLDEKLDEKLQPIYDRLDNLDVQVDSLDAKVDGLAARVDGLDAKVDGLATRVDSLDDKVNNMSDDFVSFKDRLTALEEHTKRISIIQENEILPRLQAIEECYLSTYKMFHSKAELIDSIHIDVEALKKAVTKHSKLIKKFS